MAKDESAASASVRESTTRESCTKYFDAAWWCFTPTHQIQHYYIEGDWDSCQETVSDLLRCFGNKTRLYRGEAPRKKPPSIWQHRSHDEARQFWEEDFQEVFQSEQSPSQETHIFDRDHPESPS